MIRILVGDARERLRELPDESVHCCITSPPYWGLRSYQGEPGMIGLEPTFDEHLSNLVAVFREVRRVLRRDGTLWLNYGDAYCSAQGLNSDGSPRLPKVPTMTSGGARDRVNPEEPASWSTRREAKMRPTRGNPQRWKAKDLMMMPARVAMALQADGWWLRSEIVWHKPNPMPESVRDRPTSAHEKVFLLSHSARYFYDGEAVRTPSSAAPKMPDGWDTGPGAHGTIHRSGREKGRKADPWHGGRFNRHGHPRHHHEHRTVPPEEQTVGANLRNVWRIATHAFRLAAARVAAKTSHFATFPPKLVEIPVKAGTSETGCCPECGAPSKRQVEVKVGQAKECPKTRPSHEARGGTGAPVGTVGKAGSSRIDSVRTTTGWAPTCDHESEPVPCTVLDPFAGAGTVGLVAQRLQRDAILVEISPDYAELAKRRIEDDAPLLAEVTVE